MKAVFVQLKKSGKQIINTKFVWTLDERPALSVCNDFAAIKTIKEKWK